VPLGALDRRTARALARAASACGVAAALLAASGCGGQRHTDLAGEIVFSAHAGPDESSTGIYAVDADGTGIHTVMMHGGSDPAWSPSGTTIALVRWSLASCLRPRRDCARIWVTDADGRHSHPLTAPSHRSEAPAWSPDGTEIAFDRWRDDANPFAEGTDIYVMRSNGSGVRRLTHGADNADPAWSPDGKGIAFTSDRAGNYDIYVIDVDGRGLRRLTRTPLPELSPAWSPDGREIAFAAPNGIYTIEPDGMERRVIVPSRDELSDPAWSPDGKELAVVRTLSGGQSELYVIDIGNGTATRVDTGHLLNPADPSWADAPG
jgi:Tol biopolymer transport system component